MSSASWPMARWGSWISASCSRNTPVRRKARRWLRILAGGSYELFEQKREKFPLLGVASRWDSPESARNYFEQYRQVMQGKWKKLEIASETPNRVEGHGDSGYFRVWIDGATVNQIEGWNMPIPPASP